MASVGRGNFDGIRANVWSRRGRNRHMLLLPNFQSGNTSKTTSVMLAKYLLAENASPSSTLSTPSNGGTTTDTTPSLQFYGTDSNNDQLRYQIQLDTVNTFDSQGGVSTADSYSESNKDGSTDTDYNSGNGYAGQTFTGNGGELNTATFYLSKPSTTALTLNVIIYAHSGTYGTSGVPTGAILATSDSISASLVSTSSFGLATFTFSGANRITLANGTKYVALVGAPAGNPASSNISVGFDGSSPSHGGNAVIDGISYTADSTKDVCFYITTGTPATPLIEATSGTDAGFSNTEDATFSLVAHTSASDTVDSVTTGTIDTTGANLIVIGLSYNTGSTPIISDNKGNTWTSLTPQALPSNGTSRLYYCYNPIVGSGHTFSNTGTVNYSAISVAAFKGAASEPFEDETGAKNVDATTMSVGSITPDFDNEIIISHYMFSVAGTASVDNGMTITDQTNYSGGNNYGSALAYKIQTSLASINPAWTSGGGDTPVAATIATFKARGSQTDLFNASDTVDYTVQAGDALVVDTYYWRARAIDINGTNEYGSWSSTFSFDVTSGGGSTGQVKVWNGSAWVAKPVKVWNGSAWVTKPVKVYNGSSFVVTNY